VNFRARDRTLKGKVVKKGGGEGKVIVNSMSEGDEV